jgi:hypothetical protein
LLDEVGYVVFRALFVVDHDPLPVAAMVNNRDMRQILADKHFARFQAERNPLLPNPAASWEFPF